MSSYLGEAPTQMQTLQRYMPGMSNEKQLVATAYTAINSIIRDSQIVKKAYDNRKISDANAAIRRMQTAVNLLIA